MGKILRKVHTIELDYFGSISNENRRYKSLKDFTIKELRDHDYRDLPSEFSCAYVIISKAKDVVTASLDDLSQSSPVLVHDDANDGNVMWNNGNPILIDWTDSLAAPLERDFACLTFRQDEPVLEQIEKGYVIQVDRSALRVHQIVRLIRLGQFYYLEDGDIDELRKMMERLETLLTLALHILFDLAILDDIGYKLLKFLDNWLNLILSDMFVTFIRNLKPR